MEGDVWVFDGAATVGVYEGLRFRAVKRTTLPAPLSNRDLPQEVTNSQNAATFRPALQDTSTLSVEIANIVADELGRHVEDLLDEMCLSELGIDSLLAVSISSRLQDSLHLECPSSTITDYETIGQLKKIFEACSTGWSSGMSSKSTPSTDKDNSDQNLPPNSVTTGESSDLSKAPNITRTFYRVLADELDIDMRGLHPGIHFSDLGVDSLLSLSITSEFAARCNFHLPTLFFHEHPTIEKACTFLTKTVNGPQMSREMLPPSKQPECSECPYFYLQGPATPSSPKFSLFPDGSGSFSSYANLPRLSAAFSVIAFDSPFHDHPGNFNISLQNITHIFVRQLLILQPGGPYLLGGWCIGGVYAYEATAQLLQLGKQVKGLILLDAPCPTTLPPLPMDTIGLLEGLGVFDQIKRREAEGRVSTTTLKHFASSIGALENYSIEPLPQTKPTQPICRIIWARHGVLEGLSTDKREGFLAPHSHDVANFDRIQRWLMTSRENYSPNGWDKLVTTEIKCSIVDGDHFSMMRDPKVWHSHQVPVNMAFANHNGQQAPFLAKAIHSALMDICKS